MITLKTEQQFKFGQTNVLPIVGAVQISETGTFEVESLEIAEQIEALGIGFSIDAGKVEQEGNIQEVEAGSTITEKVPPVVNEVVPNGNLETEEEINKKSEENTSLETEDDKDTIEGSSTLESESVNAELIASLQEKTLEELRILAKPFPRKEWKDLNQAGMVEFLTGKLK